MYRETVHFTVVQELIESRIRRRLYTFVVSQNMTNYYFPVLTDEKKEKFYTSVLANSEHFLTKGIPQSILCPTSQIKFKV